MTLAKKLEKLNKMKSNKGITFISNRSEEKFVSYCELYNKSLRVLHHLQSCGLQPKQELVFQIDDNETFMYVFWSCMLGGIIPVPVTPATAEEYRHKVIKIWKTLHHPYLMIDKKSFATFDTFMVEKDINEKTIEETYC